MRDCSTSHPKAAAIGESPGFQLAANFWVELLLSFPIPDFK